MFDKLALGIIYQDGKAINHRSLLKILLNPWLRLIGWQLGTNFKNEEPGEVMLVRCTKQKLKFSFNYELRPGQTVVPKRQWI